MTSCRRLPEYSTTGCHFRHPCSLIFGSSRSRFLAGDASPDYAAGRAQGAVHRRVALVVTAVSPRVRRKLSGVLGSSARRDGARVRCAGRFESLSLDTGQILLVGYRDQRGALVRLLAEARWQRGARRGALRRQAIGVFALRPRPGSRCEMRRCFPEVAADVRSRDPRHETTRSFRGSARRSRARGIGIVMLGCWGRHGRLRAVPRQVDETGRTEPGEIAFKPSAPLRSRGLERASDTRDCDPHARAIDMLLDEKEPHAGTSREITGA